MIFIIINKLKQLRELKDPSVDADNIILHVIQKILNYIPTTRIVYRQESVMDIAKLPLTTSSEQIVPVHAIGYYRIDDTPSKQSLMSLNAHRKTKLNQNFVEFFYKTYNKNKTKKNVFYISVDSTVVLFILSPTITLAAS